MLTGLYSAATAMDAAALQHDLIAHNLAHAHHPGYRRVVPVAGTFESALLGGEGDTEGPPPLSTMGTNSSEQFIDFSPGAVVQTDRTLDFALQGDGFFVVEGPNGPLYTRNGAFLLNSEGQLVTADGLPVSGAAGPITFPPETALDQVNVTPDGRILVGQQELGQLSVVNFEELDQLQPAGITLFQTSDDVAPIESEARIIQGAREGSNVSPVLEMVRMIDGMRQYEAAARALQSITEAVEQSVSPASV